MPEQPAAMEDHPLYPLINAMSQQVHSLREEIMEMREMIFRQNVSLQQQQDTIGQQIVQTSDTLGAAIETIAQDDLPRRSKFGPSLQDSQKKYIEANVIPEIRRVVDANLVALVDRKAPLKCAHIISALCGFTPDSPYLLTLAARLDSDSGYVCHHIYQRVYNYLKNHKGKAETKMREAPNNYQMPDIEETLASYEDKVKPGKMWLRWSQVEKQHVAHLDFPVLYTGGKNEEVDFGPEHLVEEGGRFAEILPDLAARTRENYAREPFDTLETMEEDLQTRAKQVRAGKRHRSGPPEERSDREDHDELP